MAGFAAARSATDSMRARMPARLAFAALILLVAAACGGASEYLLIERFFAASRLRDRTALARFATVVFEPNLNGTVSAFEIVSVTPERAAAPSDTSTPDVDSAADIRRVAAISLADPLNPVDTRSADVSVSVREVTVQAHRRLPDGMSRTEGIVVALQRATITGESARQGNWVVTGFR